jgi:hypothetical protein
VTVPEAEAPPSYDPVGRCIYCGATAHSPGRARLGDEHIIPEGLAGTLILPEACCQRHEGLTSKVERFCQKSMLGALRYRFGYPTKRPKDRPSTLPVEFKIDGRWQAREVPVAECPLTLVIPRLPPPSILTGVDPRTIKDLTFYWSVISTEEEMLKLCQEHKATGIKPVHGKARYDMIIRLLAKIAHGYVTAELGYGNFKPLLLDVIEGTSDNPLELVGGLMAALPPTEFDHELAWWRLERQGRTLLVVRVRLFGIFGFPLYYCVVGEL